jgi:hypothetical protein
MHLVPKAQETSHDVANVWEINHSTIYNSYQHSLNSLQDILTRVRVAIYLFFLM